VDYCYTCSVVCLFVSVGHDYEPTEMSALIRVVLVMIMSPTEMSALIRVVLVMIMSPQK